MSTKIYYGVKFKEHTDLESMKNSLLTECKTILNKLYNQITPDDVDLKTALAHQKEIQIEFGVAYDKETNSYYGMPFGYHGVSQAIVELDMFEDFAYWNNTDPPEDVSDEEWDQRKIVWNRILPGHTTFAEQMFVITIKPDLY